MGRQLPIDFVIKKLRIKLGEEKILCNEDHRIQITDEDNGELIASVEHNIEPNITWLWLFSEEMEMDFQVSYNGKTGKIDRDKKVKAVNEMIKFTTDDVFVETLFEKIMALNKELIAQRDQ